MRSLQFTPFRWQDPLLSSTHKRKVINGARRAGKSRIISGKPAHRGRFFQKSVALIIAPTHKQSIEDMRLAKDFIAMDPHYPRIVRFSDEQIEISNGSRIIIVTATEVSARGFPDPDLLIVDEGAFVMNDIFIDCVLPMLSGNPQCELIVISSAHGKTRDPGKFFFELCRDSEWERYEVRAPFDISPGDPFKLVPAMPEAQYKALRAKQGIHAFYSPRHGNKAEQEFILRKQGPQKYRQNQLCEFVETEEQVFSYEEIEGMFKRQVKPMDFGLGKEREVQALEIR